MNESKLTLILSAIACISSIAAALIYYFTLKEIKKQRQTTYKPELYIDKLNLHLIYKDDNLKPEYINTNPKYEKNNYKLKCYNLGLGAAKNISIEVNIDLNEFTDKINSLILNNGNEIQIDIYSKSISIKADELRITTTHFLENQNNQFLSFILPVSFGKNEYEEFHIPEYLIDFYKIYFYLIFNSYKNSSDNKVKYLDFYEPVFSLKLKYQDLYDDFHDKNYNLKLNINMFSEFEVHGLIEQF